MFDVTNDIGIIVYIENRDAKTIRNIIQQHMKSGTEIWTDWKGYQKLDNFNGVLPYTHDRQTNI